jgi:hypothetical protein
MRIRDPPFARLKRYARMIEALPHNPKTKTRAKKRPAPADYFFYVCRG